MALQSHPLLILATITCTSIRALSSKRPDTVGEFGSLVEGGGVGWVSCLEIVHVAPPAAAGPTRARRHRPHRPGRVPPRQSLPPPARPARPRVRRRWLC